MMEEIPGKASDDAPPSRSRFSLRNFAPKAKDEDSFFSKSSSTEYSPPRPSGAERTNSTSNRSKSQSFTEGTSSSRSRASSSSALDPGAKAIANHMLGDQPAGAEDEKLGFTPYVAAIAKFLTDPFTKTPLTLSVEGRWGSGKSSFMLQLEEALRDTGRRKVVRFNAWQYNADEGLWAAFIRDFDKQLSESLTPAEKVVARLRLVKLRVSWQDATETLKMVLWLLASSIALFAIVNYLHAHLHDFMSRMFAEGDPKKAAGKTLAVIGGAGGSAAAILVFFNQLHDLLGSPANLKKGTRLFSRPDYQDKLPFIHHIAQDFQSIVSAYAGDDDVYVFIDDLDRCEYSKAAELMQALLTLLSSAPKIALIVGLDRDKVAAALAAKQEKLLPYLYNVEAKESFAVGMLYGHRFLEKFIQLSYSMPVPSTSGLKAMINPTVERPPDAVPDSKKSPGAIRIVNGEDDSETLNACIDMAGKIFDQNPRNVKQFINAFRLQTFIANETGLLSSSKVGRTGKLLTLPQLAKFVALSMRWSSLVHQAASDPSFMKKLELMARGLSSYPPVEDPTATPEDRVLLALLRDANFYVLLCFGSGEDYSLADLDFGTLTEVVPVQPTRPNVRAGSTWEPNQSGQYPPVAS